MDKQTLLQLIKTFAEQQQITQAEVSAIFEKLGQTTRQRRINLAAIFYYLGAVIVALGIIILCWEHWQLLPKSTRIFMTLGGGIAAYCIGSLFNYSARFSGPANAFYCIFNLILPIGLWILFDNKAGFDSANSGLQTLIFGTMFGLQLFSYLLFRKPLFVIFSILFGSLLFFYAADLTLAKYLAKTNVFLEYRFLTIGLGYLWLGYYFALSRQLLSKVLYGIGSCLFLTASLLLGDWTSPPAIFWELIFPGLAFGCMFLSIYLQQRILLVFGAIYLMAYILKVTDAYFATSLGWPLALVLAGLLLIGVGMLAFRLRHFVFTRIPMD